MKYVLQAHVGPAAYPAPRAGPAALIRGAVAGDGLTGGSGGGDTRDRREYVFDLCLFAKHYYFQNSETFCHLLPQ